MAVVKMINNKSQSIQGLLCLIAYACKDAKTNHGGQQLITGINCVPSLAFDEFMTTKRLYNQDGGRMFYHMVQSFSPEENITPEVAHEIACKLADAIPGFETCWVSSRTMTKSRIAPPGITVLRSVCKSITKAGEKSSPVTIYYGGISL